MPLIHFSHDLRTGKGAGSQKSAVASNHMLLLTCCYKIETKAIGGGGGLENPEVISGVCGKASLTKAHLVAVQEILPSVSLLSESA